LPTSVRPGSVSYDLSDVPRTDPTFFKQGTADQTGGSFPLGATVFGDGVNFSVFSRQASRVELLLFDDAAAARSTRAIDLDARKHRI
jgi:pullulanase/glycogen debranching enzyme